MTAAPLVNSPPLAAKRAVVFNVKFSANLGDGLIAEAMEDALGACPDRLCLDGFDLAGREAWGDVATRNRRVKLAVLSAMPGAARRQLTAAALRGKMDMLGQSWRPVIAAADHVVIGGGHLFQDDNLNFPVKVGALLDICADLRVPVSVHAVGVSADWSDRAARLFGRLADCRIGALSVRDTRSFHNWARHFAGTPLDSPMIVPDPVLALDPAVAPAPSREDGAVIGLNVAAPALLAWHGPGNGGGLPGFFVEVAHQLALRGHRVVLHTNGAAEDEAALDRVAASRRLQVFVSAGRIRRAPRPERPADLVARMAGLNAVIAHRLHASILAYAMDRPPVGLGWDEKVESFYRQTGRIDAFLPHDRLDADRTVDLVERALAEGLDPARRRRLRTAARDSLARLRQEITA